MRTNGRGIRMKRKKIEKPIGAKLTDTVNLGVIAKMFPRGVIDKILHETGTTSIRQRALPAHVVVYYVIAMTLYMHESCREVLRVLLEGLRGLRGMGEELNVAGKSGISQARKRLGSEPVRQLYDEIVTPIAVKSPAKSTRGAWYRDWRVVTIDGSTLDVADSVENERAFGSDTAPRGQRAFPKIRFVSLLENGTHVLFASRLGAFGESEISLARQVLPRVGPGMLCLADRNFFGYELWREAQATGADLLWRVNKRLRLPCLERFEDGSCLSMIFPNEKERRHNRGGIVVRVIEYRLKGGVGAEPRYRVITTILDPARAPARELAALYHERWEIETVLDEVKTHLRGAHIVLRSKRPELVRQEFYGFMMGHFAVRGLMHEAALSAGIDSDQLSFVHSVRVIRRKMATFCAFSPSAAQRAA
jgi:hypothetical protein